MERLRSLTQLEQFALCLYRSKKDPLIILQQAQNQHLGFIALILKPYDSHYAVSGTDFIEIYEIAGNFKCHLLRNQKLRECYQVALSLLS